jgi:hypothetical protein
MARHGNAVAEPVPMQQSGQGVPRCSGFLRGAGLSWWGHGSGGMQEPDRTPL